MISQNTEVKKNKIKMEEIKITYRDMEISYHEEYERWSCQIDNREWQEKQTLKECKKLIDLFFKKQIENTECIYLGINSFRNDFGSKRFITSIAENGDAWIKNEKGIREKFSQANVDEYLAIWNDSNLKIIEEYKEQLKIIEAEKKKAKDILLKLERVPKRIQTKNS